MMKLLERQVPLWLVLVCFVTMATTLVVAAWLSSRLADEPTVVDVVDVVRTDGRLEMPNPEAFTEGHDGPVAFRIVEDGEVVMEFVCAKTRRPGG